jgi:hypothetical protein
MIKVGLQMIRTPFNRVIFGNGGTPSIYLEQLLFPIIERDFTKRIESHPSSIAKKQLFDAVFRGDLPNGWQYAGSYKGTPQIHLRYTGDVLKKNPMGESVDVFLCIATTAQNEEDLLNNALRAVYVMDIPYLEGDRDRHGKFFVPPFNTPAAWFTVLIYGIEELNVSWKMSHSVEATIRADGEVNYKDMI